MTDYEWEEERRKKHAQKIAEMKRQKKLQQERRARFKRLLPIGAGALVLFLLLGGVLWRGLTGEKNKEEESAGIMSAESTLYTEEIKAAEEELKEDEEENRKEENRKEESRMFTASTKDSTQEIGSDIVSSQAILVDMQSDTILAQKEYQKIISPASMTKILTVLVAAEQVENLDDIFTMTIDITDYSYVNDCSNVGFEVGEKVTVRDLFYGTILPSGADAAVGLATYVAGSQEAFVELMNEKLKKMGLSDTAHFTNCVGLYDEEHYCTVYDMAMILRAALDNELCREVLSAHTYTTSKTGQHPEGITVSNWFLRRIEDKDTKGEVLCGKTGYVVQSGNCAASYALDETGNGYICVTAGATSAWRCIYDQVDLYSRFLSDEPQSASASEVNLPLQNGQNPV